MGANAGKVLMNLGEIAVGLVGNFVGIAFSIASGGATLPLEAIGIVNTAAQITSFIDDPSGNINQARNDALKWVGDSIGLPNADTHIISAVNKLNSAVTTNTTGMSLLTASKLKDNENIAVSRIKGIDGMPSSFSISSINDPAIKQMRMFNSNMHDQTRLAIVKAAYNENAIKNV